MTTASPRLGAPGPSTKFVFNPFTGNLDIAGQATYIETDDGGTWVDLSNYATIEYVDEQDQLLQDQIDVLGFTDQEIKDDLEQEIFDRKQGDILLQENIDAEEAARIAGDAFLSDRIDNLVIEAGGVQSISCDAPIVKGGTNNEPIISLDLQVLNELP